MMVQREKLRSETSKQPSKMTKKFPDVNVFRKEILKEPMAKPSAIVTEDENGPQTSADTLQQRIGYTFRDPAILHIALTHSSGATTRFASNERYEFLGDAILGEVVCIELFARFPEADEGELTRLKSDVVSRETCARIALGIGLDKALIVGKAIAMLSILPMSIPANAMEALIAAIYLDSGRRAVKTFIRRFFWKEIDRAATQSVEANAKSALQQLVQHEFSCSPRYVLLDEQGPAHHRAFQIAVRIGTREYPPAWGASKKQAEQLAAHHALEELHRSNIPSESQP